LITKDDLDHTAQLARLALTDEEGEVFIRQLNDILEGFRALDSLDTANVLPTTHVLPLQNVFRGDQVGQQMPQESALANCPDREENYFKVPRIL